jgi:hypothetical protein
MKREVIITADSAEVKIILFSGERQENKKYPHH